LIFFSTYEKYVQNEDRFTCVKNLFESVDPLIYQYTSIKSLPLETPYEKADISLCYIVLGRILRVDAGAEAGRVSRPAQRGKPVDEEKFRTGAAGK
jgi:hypothetical protein